MCTILRALRQPLEDNLVSISNDIEHNNCRTIGKLNLYNCSLSKFTFTLCCSIRKVNVKEKFTHVGLVRTLMTCISFLSIYLSYIAEVCQRDNAELKAELKLRDAVQKPSVVKRLREQLKRRDAKIYKGNESKFEKKEIRNYCRRLKYAATVSTKKRVRATTNVASTEAYYQDAILKMEEQLEETQQQSQLQLAKRKGCYSAAIRQQVYTYLDGNAPTDSIPRFVQCAAQTYGVTLSSVPSTAAVKRMAIEMGVISDIQVQYEYVMLYRSHS